VYTFIIVNLFFSFSSSFRLIPVIIYILWMLYYKKFLATRIKTQKKYQVDCIYVKTYLAHYSNIENVFKYFTKPICTYVVPTYLNARVRTRIYFMRRRRCQRSFEIFPVSTSIPVEQYCDCHRKRVSAIFKILM